MYRAFFALPDSITGAEKRPVNALLGTANLVLRTLEEHAPRAVVLCWGAEAAHYRTDAFPAYHADRPPMPDDLAWQWERAPAFFDAFAWRSLNAGELEADDLLGTLAALELDAGGSALLFTGDRDMFQCAGERVTVLYPSTKSKDGPLAVDAGGVRRRYGVEPEQVPDFIALRGDPSDGLPGAKGIGEKGAATLLREHGTLEALIATAQSSATTFTPRVRAALTEQADELRAFKDIATLRRLDVERPADAPLDTQAASAAAAEIGMGALAKRLAAWSS